jgi:hypothetical protein
VTDTNVFRLSQPGDPLMEVLRNGARALLAHDEEFGRVGEAPQPAATGADSMAGKMPVAH